MIVLLLVISRRWDAVVNPKSDLEFVGSAMLCGAEIAVEYAWLSRVFA